MTEVEILSEQRQNEHFCHLYICQLSSSNDSNDPLYHSIRPKLEESEKKMFQEIASIVRWIDFDSRGAKRDMTQERDKITNMIKLFEVSLAEVVKLIYQCQQQGEVSSGSPRQRRSVSNTIFLHAVTS